MSANFPYSYPWTSQHTLPPYDPRKTRSNASLNQSSKSNNNNESTTTSPHAKTASENTPPSNLLQSPLLNRNSSDHATISSSDSFPQFDPANTVAPRVAGVVVNTDALLHRLSTTSDVIGGSESFDASILRMSTLNDNYSDTFEQKKQSASNIRVPLRVLQDFVPEGAQNATAASMVNLHEYPQHVSPPLSRLPSVSIQVDVKLNDDNKTAQVTVEPSSRQQSQHAMMRRQNSDMPQLDREVSYPSLDFADTVNLFPPIITDVATGICIDDDGNEKVNHYVLVGMLGAGSYGTVHLGIDVTDDAPCAIKMLDILRLRRKSGFPDDDGHYKSYSPLELARQEAKVMTKLRHPNLVRLKAVLENSVQLCLVLEYMSGGALCPTPDSSLEEFNVVDQSAEYVQMRRQFRDILDGLYYLHRRNIVHMDIKPANILLDEDGACKLADFGVCAVLQPKAQGKLEGIRGTPLFFAPEMTSGETFYGPAADVWAFGVTMYMRAFGRHPFARPTVEEVYECLKMPQQQLVFPTPTSYKNIPRELVDIISRCLTWNPSHRITSKQLLCHAFLRNPGPYPPLLEWCVREWKMSQGRPVRDNTIEDIDVA